MKRLANILRTAIINIQNSTLILCWPISNEIILLSIILELILLSNHLFGQLMISQCLQVQVQWFQGLIKRWFEDQKRQIYLINRLKPLVLEITLLKLFNVLIFFEIWEKSEHYMKSFNSWFVVRIFVSRYSK